MRLVNHDVHGQFASPLGEALRLAQETAEREANKLGGAQRGGSVSGGLTAPGAAPGDWRAAVQLFAGGALNADTPKVAAVQFAYGSPALVHSCVLADGVFDDAQLVGGNLQLDWLFPALGVNCKCRLKMNEVAWTGAADEILDDSGHGHHGTKTATVTQATDGWLGKEASYPGTDTGERIVLADHADWTQDEFTAQGWLKWNGVTSENASYDCMVPWMQGATAAACAWGLRYQRQAAAQAIIAYHNGVAVLTYPAALPTDYHHCALTYSRSNNRVGLWLNGVQVATAALSAATNNSTAPVRLGSEGTTLHPWAGRLGQFQFDAEELYVN